MSFNSEHPMEAQADQLYAQLTAQSPAFLAVMPIPKYKQFAVFLDRQHSGLASLVPAEYCGCSIKVRLASASMFSGV